MNQSLAPTSSFKAWVAITGVRWTCGLIRAAAAPTSSSLTTCWFSFYNSTKAPRLAALALAYTCNRKPDLERSPRDVLELLERQYTIDRGSHVMPRNGHLRQPPRPRGRPQRAAPNVRAPIRESPTATISRRGQTTSRCGPWTRSGEPRYLQIGGRYGGQEYSGIRHLSERG